jgi:hypothetical protein
MKTCEKEKEGHCLGTAAQPEAKFLNFYGTQGINSASLCSLAGRYDNHILGSYSVSSPHRLFKHSSTAVPHLCHHFASLHVTSFNASSYSALFLSTHSLIPCLPLPTHCLTSRHISLIPRRLSVRKN